MGVTAIASVPTCILLLVFPPVLVPQLLLAPLLLLASPSVVDVQYTYLCFFPIARVSVSAVAAVPTVVEVCSATGVRLVLLSYMLAKVSVVAGDLAVAVTLLCCGIKKIKHFRLSDYDYRTGNFSAIVISIIRPFT